MARITEAQKARNRERILDAGGRCFRRLGTDAVGIADVMRAAGMTHGGFYNHFEAKEDLIAAVVSSTFAGSVAFFSGVIDAATGSRVAAVVAAYLRPEHRDDGEGLCPSSALAVDAVRHGPRAQRAYADGMRALVEVVADALERDRADAGSTGGGEARGVAVALLSGMVGALTMARAVRDVDLELSDAILADARADLLRRLD